MKKLSNTEAGLKKALLMKTASPNFSFCNYDLPNPFIINIRNLNIRNIMSL